MCLSAVPVLANRGSRCRALQFPTDILILSFDLRLVPVRCVGGTVAFPCYFLFPIAMMMAFAVFVLNLFSLLLLFPKRGRMTLGT